jgi:glycosyltransferase involved in cell wall biosynthesis
MSIYIDRQTAKVTVLMAVYNGERYLREAIDSILHQTFQDFELTIVNDGSVDRTAEIISSYNDPRIQLIHNDRNLGLTKSLNKGLKLARGQFVARQDADDISEPERLAKQVDFLEAHPDIALLGTFYQEIDDLGKKVSEHTLPCDCTKIRWDLLFYTPFVHSSVMFRKSIVIEKIGLYNENFSYAQDYDYWCRIALSLKVANLSVCLLRYRLNPASMTATYGKAVCDEPTEIVHAYLKSLLSKDSQPDWKPDKLDLSAVSIFLVGSLELLTTLDLHQIDKSIRSILSLHAPFCDYYELSSTECQQHYTDICVYISQRYLDIAYYYSDRDKYLSWQSLVRAVNIHKQVIFTRRWIELILKLIVGSHILRSVKKNIKR